MLFSICWAEKKNTLFLSLSFLYLLVFVLPVHRSFFNNQKTLVWVILHRPPKAAFAHNIGADQVQCQAKPSFWEVTELILKWRKKTGIFVGRGKTLGLKKKWGLRICESKESWERSLRDLEKSAAVSKGEG